MHWRIELFGGLRAIYGDDTLAQFRSRKTAALLAYLAFFRGLHPRDKLVEMLWPEFPLEAGRNSLRVALADLRRRSSLTDEGGQMLPPPLLLQDRGSIGLCREATTDVAEFEKAIGDARRALSLDVRIAAYEQAQTLYQGPLLPGLYESWIPVEEARLEATYLYALRALQGFYDNAGDSTRAFEMAQLAARFEPQTAQKVEPTRSGTPRSRVGKKRSDREETVSAPHNTSVAALPAAFTRFFGREHELSELATRMLQGQTRLLTITGGGGLGKTRLAVELARRLEHPLPPSEDNPANRFSRIFWAPLADSTEAERLPEDLIKVLNLRVDAGKTGGQQKDILQAIARFLRDQSEKQARVLLLLDNFEQLLPQGAIFVGELLESVPQLSLLVTSRQRLNLGGEWEHRIAPLTLPSQSLPGPPIEEDDTSWDVQQLAILRASSSVQLYADRARGARADWRLLPREAHTLVSLLHRLEGVPLAIELVASRAGVLSLDQMLSRLSQSWQWVSSRDLHRPTRHRSLYAVLDWSLSLLPEQEREIFARLSIFHGGWTLEDAGAVLPDVDPDVLLDSLQSLRDASLITSDESERGELRFSMLEMVRQIAEERLNESQRLAMRYSHAEFYLQLAERAGTNDKEFGRWGIWGKTEGHNFSAALGFWATTDIERALNMAASLWWYWVFEYHLPEGRHLLRDLLDNPQVNDFPIQRARAQACAAYIALLSGYYDEIEGLLYPALQVWEKYDCQNDRAGTLNLLGALAVVRDDKQKARDFYAQSLAIRRNSGNERELTIAVNALAGVERSCGHLEAARNLCAEALERARKFDDNSAQSWAYNTLGCIAFDEGNLPEARQHQQKSLAMRRRHKQLVGQATCLQALGDIELHEQNLQLAHNYFQQALNLWHQTKQIPKAQVVQQKLDLVAQQMAQRVS